MGAPKKPTDPTAIAPRQVETPRVDSDLGDLRNVVEQMSARLSELQGQVAAQEVVVHVLLRVMTERDDQRRRAVEIALWVAEHERVDEHGEDDEIAKALATMRSRWEQL